MRNAFGIGIIILAVTMIMGMLLVSTVKGTSTHKAEANEIIDCVK